jgi:hypothetical protein
MNQTLPRRYRVADLCGASRPARSLLHAIRLIGELRLLLEARGQQKSRRSQAPAAKANHCGGSQAFIE